MRLRSGASHVAFRSSGLTNEQLHELVPQIAAVLGQKNVRLIQLLYPKAWPGALLGALAQHDWNVELLRKSVEKIIEISDAVPTKKGEKKKK